MNFSNVPDHIPIGVIIEALSALYKRNIAPLHSLIYKEKDSESNHDNRLMSITCNETNSVMKKVLEEKSLAGFTANSIAAAAQRIMAAGKYFWQHKSSDFIFFEYSGREFTDILEMLLLHVDWTDEDKQFITCSEDQLMKLYGQIKEECLAKRFQ